MIFLVDTNENIYVIKITNRIRLSAIFFPHLLLPLMFAFQ